MSLLGVPLPSSPGGPLPGLVCAPLLEGLLNKTSVQGDIPSRDRGLLQSPTWELSALILLTASHDILLKARGCWEGGGFNIRVPC